MGARERERQGGKRVKAEFRDYGQGTGSAVFEGKQGGYFRDRLPGNLPPEVGHESTVCEAADLPGTGIKEHPARLLCARCIATAAARPQAQERRCTSRTTSAFGNSIVPTTTTLIIFPAQPARP